MGLWEWQPEFAQYSVQVLSPFEVVRTHGIVEQVDCLSDTRQTTSGFFIHSSDGDLLMQVLFPTTSSIFRGDLAMTSNLIFVDGQALEADRAS